MIDFLNRKNSLLILLVVLFLIYFSPYLINGENSYIRIQDNLDQINMIGIFDKEFVGDFFLDESQPDFYMPNDHPIYKVNLLNLDRLFFWTFDYFWGFVFNEFFYRVLSFFGIFFLLKRFKLNQEFPDFLLILISFAFITLPFWPQGNLSVAGVPLFILLFHNLHIKKYIGISLISLFIFGFYSSLPIVGIFLTICSILFVAYTFTRKEDVNLLIWGILVAGVGYSISHYILILNQIYFKIPSIRQEMTFNDTWYGYNIIDFFRAIWSSKSHFFFLQSHTISNHIYLILPTSILIYAYCFYKKQICYNKIILTIFSFLIFASVWYTEYILYPPLIDFFNNLKLGFNFSRLFFLSTALWYILWGLLLFNLYNVFADKKMIIVIITILSISQSLINSLNNNGYDRATDRPTFIEITSTKQFNEIKSKIGINKDDRIGCIGFLPSIANYNGLKTIGAFMYIFGLDAKHNFYKIIKDELEKDEFLKRYYLEWGSRAYLFDDKINRNYFNQTYIKEKIPKIVCDLDIEELRKNGVNYIFSTSEIENANKIGIKEVLESSSDEYYYRFYIYKL